MAISVMTWVWEHSKSRHSARLVLLAIADAANADGVAYPSNAELKQKAGLSERSVQSAVAELAGSGELEVKYNSGPNNTNLYRVLTGSPREDCTPQEPHPPAESAPPRKNRTPPQNLRGTTEDDASPQVTTGTPAESAPTPQNLHPAESAPGTVKQDLSPTERDIYIAREDDPPPRRPKAARGTRIPGDFEVTPAMADWARREVPALIAAGRGKYETDRFVDYYRAASGANARKIDWPATWRNWMRKADDDWARSQGRPGAPLAPAPQSGADRARVQAADLKARLAGKAAS